MKQGVIEHSSIYTQPESSKANERKKNRRVKENTRCQHRKTREREKRIEVTLVLFFVL